MIVANRLTMKLYAIARWDELFENNRSRTVKDLDWVAVPNHHDGENYSRLISHSDGAVLFSAWNLMIQVASKCKPRGVLLRDNRTPHDSVSLSMKTRAPKAWFDKAFAYLESCTDWLHVTDVPDTYREPDRPPPALCHPTDEEGKGRERKEGNTTLPKEAEFWNSNCGLFPKIAAMNEDRLRRLRQRRQDPFWVANYEKALLRCRQSDFCNGKNDRRWKPDFDWILQPNVVTKIMEGKYDNRVRNGVIRDAI